MHNKSQDPLTVAEGYCVVALSAMDLYRQDAGEYSVLRENVRKLQPSLKNTSASSRRYKACLKALAETEANLTRSYDSVMMAVEKIAEIAEITADKVSPDPIHAFLVNPDPSNLHLVRKFCSRLHTYLSHYVRVSGAKDRSSDATATPAEAEQKSQRGEDCTETTRTKRRGRPPASDPKEDAKIATRWETGGYRAYADLGRDLGISGKQVCKAIDRYRSQRRNK